MSNHLGDMVLHGLNERLIGPGSTSDYTGQRFSLFFICYLLHQETNIPQLGNC